MSFPLSPSTHSLFSLSWQLDYHVFPRCSRGVFNPASLNGGIQYFSLLTLNLGDSNTPGSFGLMRAYCPHFTLQRKKKIQRQTDKRRERGGELYNRNRKGWTKGRKLLFSLSSFPTESSSVAFFWRKIILPFSFFIFISCLYNSLLCAGRVLQFPRLYFRGTRDWGIVSSFSRAPHVIGLRRAYTYETRSVERRHFASVAKHLKMRVVYIVSCSAKVSRLLIVWLKRRTSGRRHRDR